MNSTSPQIPGFQNARIWHLVWILALYANMTGGFTSPAGSGRRRRSCSGWLPGQDCSHLKSTCCIYSIETWPYSLLIFRNLCNTWAAVSLTFKTIEYDKRYRFSKCVQPLWPNQTFTAPSWHWNTYSSCTVPVHEHGTWTCMHGWLSWSDRRIRL
jgi:hypothetical protein